jgi:N-acetylglucosaminyl-diphospho-decaprenol L-rhamnosyltransferase
MVVEGLRHGRATVSPVGAVVVNHEAGAALGSCVASLRAEGIQDVVVVDNASNDGSPDALEASDPDVRVVRTGRNLGYGAGANRGLLLVDNEFVLVCNPDVVVHAGSVAALAAALEGDPAAALAGPAIFQNDGRRYSSARRFPTWGDAVGHAVLSPLSSRNRFSRRYRMDDLSATATVRVDWVSGACFMARRSALVRLGGFDERYFMYVEDTDLCWRAAQAGFGVLYVPAATVSHDQGLSTARRPYRMLVAHHRSALRFAARTATGWRRATLPAAAVLLTLRLAVVVALRAARPRSGPVAQSTASPRPGPSRREATRGAD